MTLSILVPSIPSRVSRFFTPLYQKLESQVANNRDVEILAFFDNKRRSVGLKRDGLVKLAKGEYIVMVDDDDDISDSFVADILVAIQSNPGVDLITYNTQASLNGGNWFTVRYNLDYENQGAYRQGETWMDIQRKPFHNMVWRTSIAQSEDFADASYGEDYHWAQRLHPKVIKSANVDKVLAFYRFNDSVTEAEHTFPT